MTDRITAILDVLRAAEDLVTAFDAKVGWATCYNGQLLTEKIIALRSSTPPDFTKLVEAALPCEGWAVQPYCRGTVDESEHVRGCPAHYRPAILALISAILASAILASEKKD